jgi:F-type H+-transporting ATPase subunit delta
MKISKQARHSAKVLFRSCLVGGALDENRVRETVRLIIAQKPRGYVGILDHFQRLVKLELDRRTATVESAVPLSAELSASVQNNLNRVYGSGLTVSFRQEPSLIGGLRVRVGSDVYDGSIRARLNALRESF